MEGLGHRTVVELIAAGRTRVLSCLWHSGPPRCLWTVRRVNAVVILLLLLLVGGRCGDRNRLGVVKVLLLLLHRGHLLLQMSRDGRSRVLLLLTERAVVGILQSAPGETVCVPAVSSSALPEHDNLCHGPTRSPVCQVSVESREQRSERPLTAAMREKARTTPTTAPAMAGTLLLPLSSSDLDDAEADTAAATSEREVAAELARLEAEAEDDRTLFEKEDEAGELVRSREEDEEEWVEEADELVEREWEEEEEEEELLLVAVELGEADVEVDEVSAAELSLSVDSELVKLEEVRACAG